MNFLRAFIPLFIFMQTTIVSASPLENFTNAPGVVVNSQDYFAVLEGVCNTGNPDYCQKLAFILQKRKDAKLSRDRIVSLHQNALDHYKKKCDLNDLVACQEVSIIYQVGYGRDIDLANAKIAGDRFNSLALKLCETGDALGCSYRSNWHNGTGSPGYDVTKARKYSDLSVEYFSKECSKKNALSCERLGHRYKAGQIYGGYIPYDIQRAFTLFDSACQYEHIPACIVLSNMYFLGIDVKRDKLKSYQYDKRGCDLESAISCSNLLNSGKSVSGVKRDKAETTKLRERMAYLAKRNCVGGKLPECSLLYLS